MYTTEEETWTCQPRLMERSSSFFRLHDLPNNPTTHEVNDATADPTRMASRDKNKTTTHQSRGTTLLEAIEARTFP